MAHLFLVSKCRDDRSSNPWRASLECSSCKSLTDNRDVLILSLRQSEVANSVARVLPFGAFGANIVVSCQDSQSTIIAMEPYRE